MTILGYAQKNKTWNLNNLCNVIYKALEQMYSQLICMALAMPSSWGLISSDGLICYM